MENIENLDIAGAEVCELLQYLPKEKYYKIPKKITSLFEKYKHCNIETKIDKNKRYEEQEISQTAKDIIFCIALNYWLTEEEKNKVIEKMKQNEEELKEKYNIEKIFQPKRENNLQKQIENDNYNKQKDLVLVTKQEKCFTKIVNFIKRIFRKN